MNFIKRLTFKQKIMMMLLPAVLGLVYFSAMNISVVLSKSNSASSIEPLVKLSAENSLLVHELQKERGASAGFLGSKGAKFGDVLSKQRGLTSGRLEERERFLQLSKGDLDNQEVSSVLAEISTQLGRLSDIRAKVDSQEIKLKDAVGYYTNLNKLLLSVSSKVAHIAENGRIANELLAYYSFLQGKERAGIERAVLSNAFGGGFFPMGMYKKYLHLVTEQDVYLSSFAQAANPDQVSFLKESMSHESIAKVNEMREAAASKELYLFKGTDWFKQSTLRINQLKLVEDRLTADLLASTSAQISTANKAIIQSSIIIVVVLLVVLIMGIATARLLTSQLQALVEAIDVAGRSKNLAVRAEIITEDELGASAERFNEMLSGFQAAVKNIDKGSMQLAAVAEETATTIEGNLLGLDRQHDETTLVATAIEQMSATVQEVAVNTASTSEAARQVTNLTDDGVGIVASTVGNMNKLSEDMAQASQAIMQLKEDSNQISSVVDVIKSVAEQTNLLALNAAIEAARAGDQGRGFAVVADEVRTLAQRTQSSTEEIENIVGKFQTSAGIVSKSIELCAGDANQSVEQTAVMESKLGEIQEAINEINGMCLQVSSAVEEQVAVTSEIADNARSINALADEGAEGGRQIASAAEEQARLASELQALSSSFKVS